MPEATNLTKASRGLYYSSDDLRDAPEFHAYSQALGYLTWGTWDHASAPSKSA